MPDCAAFARRKSPSISWSKEPRTVASYSAPSGKQFEPCWPAARMDLPTRDGLGASHIRFAEGRRLAWATPDLSPLEQAAADQWREALSTLGSFRSWAHFRIGVLD